MVDKGMFISFEGIDGCGKTTQARMFYEWVTHKGYPAVRVEEPGGTELGNHLRRMLLHQELEIGTRARVMLFNASRAQLCDEIILPELERGKIVVADRFYDSTTAYQCAEGGIDFGEVHKVNLFASNGLRPDLTFLIDADVDSAWKNLEKEKGRKRDRIESRGREYMERVREVFRDVALFGEDRVVIVKYVAGDIEGMHGYIADTAKKKLGL